MNIVEMAFELEHGKKVRNTLWAKDVYLYKDPNDRRLYFQDDTPYDYYLYPTSDDWEIYDEEVAQKDSEIPKELSSMAKPCKHDKKKIVDMIFTSFLYCPDCDTDLGNVK